MLASRYDAALCDAYNVPHLWRNNNALALLVRLILSSSYRRMTPTMWFNALFLPSLP